MQPTAGGVLLSVQAQPGSRKNGIAGVHAGRLKVAVTQAPERGKANKALIEVLADCLGVKRSQITLVSGATASRKKFLIAGVAVDSLRARLDELQAR